MFLKDVFRLRPSLTSFIIYSLEVRPLHLEHLVDLDRSHQSSLLRKGCLSICLSLKVPHFV